MPIEMAAVIGIARISFSALGAVQGAMRQSAMAKSLEGIKADIERIERKTDHLLVRDLLAAFNALSSIAKNGTAESLAGRLTFAEERLLASTTLNPDLELEGKKGTYWLARAHYGLAYLAHLRGDYATTALHMLHVFELEPRQSRKEIFPHFYESVFQPGFKDLDVWLDNERQELKVAIEEFKRQQSDPQRQVDSLNWKLMATVGIALLLPYLAIPTLLASIATGKALNDSKLRELLLRMLRSNFGTIEQRVQIFEAMKESELIERYEVKVDARTRESAVVLRKAF